jgi:hypothetical protein
MINMNNEKLMREFAKVALEQALQSCSEKARWTADECPDDMSGRDALLAFAAAILSTNAKVWPAEGRG